MSEEPNFEKKILNNSGVTNERYHLTDEDLTAKRKECLENVTKFRKITAAYLKALEGLFIPQCYAHTIVNAVSAFNMYENERTQGLCECCKFVVSRIADVNVINKTLPDLEYELVVKKKPEAQEDPKKQEGTLIKVE